MIEEWFQDLENNTENTPYHEVFSEFVHALGVGAEDEHAENSSNNKRWYC